MNNYLICMAFLLSGDEPSPAPNRGVACGVSSLLMFAHFEGKELDAKRLHGDLPEKVDGHSIDEIIGAARQQGISLEAIKVVNRLPDRPFIAYLRPDSGNQGSATGHFRCIRPIDGRGRQYQYVEPREPPWVLEEDEVLKEPRFSGVVLVLASSVRRTVGYFFLSIGALWGVYLVLSRIWARTRCTK